MRLNKYLAHAGVCSRREADSLIAQQRVTVNGSIPTPGQSVSEADEITVDGRVIKGQSRRIVLAFYKPVGVTCTEKDAHAEKVIKDIVNFPERVTYAGRLDKDSEGLLLLTNDGDLIQAMMRGANGHEKEYIVCVHRELSEDFRDKMEKGIYLKELNVMTKECKVELLGNNTFRIILTQGLNRQIRRMCAALGYQVRSLKRVRVMDITLGDLRPGEYRELGRTEIEHLRKECGL